MQNNVQKFQDEIWQKIQFFMQLCTVIFVFIKFFDILFF